MKKRFLSMLLVLVMALSLLPTQAYAYLGGIRSARLETRAQPVVTKLEGSNQGSRIWSMKLKNSDGSLSGEGIEFYLAVDGPHAGKSVTNSSRYHHQAYMMDSISMGVYEQAHFTLQTGGSQKELKLEKMEVIDPKKEPGFDNYTVGYMPPEDSLTVRCTFSGYGSGDPEIVCYISYYIVKLGDGVTEGQLAQDADDPGKGRAYAVVSHAWWGPGGAAIDGIRDFIFRYYQDYHGFSRMGHARAERAAHIKLSRTYETTGSDGSTVVTAKSTDITAGLGRTELSGRFGKGQISEIYSDSYGVDSPFVLADNDVIRVRNDVQPTKYASYDAAADCLSTEGSTHKLGPGPDTNGYFYSTMHVWGFRDVYGKNEDVVDDPKFTAPDAVTIPQDADKLGLYQSGSGIAVAPITDTARAAVLIKQYGEPLYTLRGNFEAKSDANGKYYEFTDGKVALTPTITASWTGEDQHFRVRVDGNGLLTGFDTTSMVQYDTPRFKLFSVEKSTMDPAGLAVEDDCLTLSMKPEENSVLVFIDIPQVSSRIDTARLKPNGDLILSGEMGLDLIFNCANEALITLNALGYGSEENADGTISFVQKGVEASGQIDTGSLLGLDLAEIEANINTFEGDEVYEFSLSLNAFDLFETEAELTLKRLNNGRLAPDDLYFLLAAQPGIPIAPPVPTAYLRGGGGGFYGLADTINGDFIAIPPIRLKISAVGDYLKIIKGKLHVTIGPSYLEYAGTDFEIAGADVLDSFNMYLRLVGEKRRYLGKEYTGVRAGGGMGVVIKAPQGDSAIFEVDGKAEASMFGGLDNYKSPTSAYLQIDSRGSIDASVMIPKQLGKLKFRRLGGKKLAQTTVDFILGAQTAVTVDPKSYAGKDAGAVLETAAGSAWNNLSVYGGVSNKGHIILHYRIYYILPDHFGGAVSLFRKVDRNWELQDEIDKNAWYIGGRRAARTWDAETYACIDDATGEQIGIAVVESSLYELPFASVEGAVPLAAVQSNGRYTETVSYTANGGDPAGELGLLLLPKNGDVTTLKNSLAIYTVNPDTQLTLVDAGEDPDNIPANANLADITTEDDEDGLLVMLGSTSGTDCTWRVEADCDFTYQMTASARPAELSFNLSGYSADSTIQNPRSGRPYAVRYYFDSAADRSGENYLIDMVEYGDGQTTGSFTVPSEGTLAPGGSYYVTAVLVEKVVGDFNGDGTIGADEYSWVTVDTKTSAAPVTFTNTNEPAAPTGAALAATGNETLTASWNRSADADGYRVTLYYQDGGSWKQAGAPYVLDNADFASGSDNPAASETAQGLSLRMAPTVGGNEVTVGGSAEAPTISSGGGSSDASPAETNYKVTVEAFKRQSSETYDVTKQNADGTSTTVTKKLDPYGVFYSRPAESSAVNLPAYTAPTVTVTYGNNGTVTLNGDNGYAALVWNTVPTGVLFTVTGSDIDGVAVTPDQAAGTFTVTGGSGAWTVTADEEALKLVENSGRVRLTVTNGADTTDYYLRLALDDVPPVLTLDEKNIRADMTTGAYTVTGVTEPGLTVSMNVEGGTPLSATAGGDGSFTLRGTLPSNMEDGFDENGNSVRVQNGFRSLISEVTAQDEAGNEAAPAPVLISARAETKTEEPDPGKSSGGGGGGGSSSAAYDVSVSKTENGTVSVSPSRAGRGDTVTVTVKPDDGYRLDKLTVLDRDGRELTLTDKGDGRFTFEMPAGTVEVKAVFAKLGVKFLDVSDSAWYADAVKWAIDKGITNGIGNDLFGPNEPCTRAQIVTFLWRAAGSPAPKGGGHGFADVKSDAYYADAVQWAVEQGVTVGTGPDTFSPDAVCTRAQAVTLLARALNASAEGKAEFSDVSAAAWYAGAVAWAVENGVTVGIGDGLFGPDGDCTRAQIVTFLYRAYQ